MLRHYLKTIAANLARAKLVTLLHVTGLSVGLACFIVSFIFIEELRTTDEGFANARRTVAITQELWMGTAAVPVVPAQPRTAAAVSRFLRTDFPALEAVALALPVGRASVSTGDHNAFVYQAAVDPQFLQIFSLRFLAGDRTNALAAADGAVITAEAARRVFGTENAVGRRLLFANQIWVTVKAVVDGPPQPSHMGDSEQSSLRFEILTRFDPKQLGYAADDWDSPVGITYALLPANGSLTLSALRTALRDFGDRHMPRSQGHSSFSAIPVSSIELSTLNARFANSGLSVTTSLLALNALVLLVACFNYASLASAVALRRGREIALRKVVGAHRAQLVVQCLLEAGAITLVALVLAVILVAAATPLLNRALPYALQLTQLARPEFWLFLVLLLTGTTLIAGAYPALVLSGLRPALALRSDVARTGPRWAFRALVTLQFAVTGFLIVMVLVVRDQNRHMGEALPGLLRNPTIALTTSLFGSGVPQDTLRTELARSAYIRSVTFSDYLPWDSSRCCWMFNLTRAPDSGQRQIQAAANPVGPQYFETTEQPLLAGRDLSRSLGDQIDLQRDVFSGRRSLPIVIDRSLAALLGWGDPAGAIGKTLTRPALWGGVPDRLLIVGVVEDGAPRLTGLAGTGRNLYLLAQDPAQIPLVRVDPAHVREAVDHINRTWSELAPRLPQELRFADGLFAQAYATFSTLSTVATVIMAFAFAIALIGLAGMAVHVTTGRLREVGVRKTLGATPVQIVRLLLFDFSKPLVVANLIAWPFAWLAAQAYLKLFISRASLTPFAFIASLLITVVVACLVVGTQALRASRVEPAHVLRYQ